jgi:hypothetical protein
MQCGRATHWADTLVRRKCPSGILRMCVRSHRASSFPWLTLCRSELCAVRCDARRRQYAGRCLIPSRFPPSCSLWEDWSCLRREHKRLDKILPRLFLRCFRPHHDTWRSVQLPRLRRRCSRVYDAQLFTASGAGIPLATSAILASRTQMDGFCGRCRQATHGLSVSNFPISVARYGDSE